MLHRYQRDEHVDDVSLLLVLKPYTSKETDNMHIAYASVAKATIADLRGGARTTAVLWYFYAHACESVHPGTFWIVCIIVYASYSPDYVHVHSYMYLLKEK